jgi:L-Ala-D/L-Glu epimerase
MAIVFTKLEIRELRIPFRFSFKHALAERRESRCLILSLTTSSNHIGYGEILTRPYLTGETVESARRDIIDLWWPKIRALRLAKDKPPFDALRSIYLFADQLGKTASWAGVDIAVADACCRATGQAISHLFGSSKMPLTLTAPIGGGNIRRVRLMTRLFKLIGFRHFKLKVGGTEDLQKVRIVRDIIGDSRDLRVDANGAWNVEEAISKAKEMSRCGVSAVEQPIPPGNAPALARVQREGGLPVIADESLCTSADARDILAAGAAGLWNIRPAKVGGFSGALEMVRIAQENRVKIHLGVLVGETSLLGAAGRALAGLADYSYVEFGFPRLLLNPDPFRGGPDGYLGTGKPLAEKPGLGIQPVPRLLDRLTLRSTTLD